MVVGQWSNPPSGRLIGTAGLSLAVFLFAPVSHAGDSAPPAAPVHPAVMPSRLAYERAPGVEACPDERAAGAILTSLLGPGAVDSTASRHIRLLLRRRPSPAREVEGHIELHDENGRRIWESDQSAGENDCRTLIASLALALRVASASLSPPPPPAPGAEGASELPTVVRGIPSPPPFFPGPAFFPRAPPFDPRTADTSRIPSFRLWGSTAAVFGSAPSTAPRLSLGVGLRWPHLTLSIEGRSVLPSRGHFRGYQLEIVRWEGAFVPCVGAGVLFACGLLTFGGLWSKLSGVRRDNGGWFHTSAGGRAGIDLEIFSSLGISTYVDVEGSFSSTGIRMDSYAAWLESPVQVALGIAVTGIFPDTPL